MGSETARDIQQDLRKLIAACHLDILPPEYRTSATLLTRVLSTLLDDARGTVDEARSRGIQADDLPSTSQHWLDEFKAGMPITLVARTKSGAIRLEPFTLPRTPAQFRAALHAFIADAPMEEILSIASVSPEARRTLDPRFVEWQAKIKATSSIEDLLALHEEVTNNQDLAGSLRAPLLQEIGKAMANLYSNRAGQSTSLTELSSLTTDASDALGKIITNKKYHDDLVGMVGIVVNFRMRKALPEIEAGIPDMKDLEEIASISIAALALPIPDTEKQSLYETINAAAQESIYVKLRAVRSENGLSRLGTYVSKFPFAPSANKEKIVQEIEHFMWRKWNAYFSPEARTAQALAKDSDERSTPESET